MANVEIFQNESFGQVRVVNRDGEPWFVAIDICTALELSNVTEALSSLDPDEKGAVPTFSNTEPMNDFEGLRAGTRLVSESGMYALIFKSRKSNAKQFRKWVTAEVIPSIRKTGNYTAPGNVPALPNFSNPAEAARAWADEYEKRQLAEQQAAAAQRDNEELRVALGSATEWKQVKAIPWLSTYYDMSQPSSWSRIGKKLSQLSRAMGKLIRTAEDSTYGSVHVYHISVIEAFHRMSQMNPDIIPGLGKALPPAND